MSILIHKPMWLDAYILAKILEYNNYKTLYKHCKSKNLCCDILLYLLPRNISKSIIKAKSTHYYDLMLENNINLLALNLRLLHQNIKLNDILLQHLQLFKKHNNVTLDQLEPLQKRILHRIITLFITNKKWNFKNKKIKINKGSAKYPFIAINEDKIHMCLSINAKKYEIKIKSIKRPEFNVDYTF